MLLVLFGIGGVGGMRIVFVTLLVAFGLIACGGIGIDVIVWLFVAISLTFVLVSSLCCISLLHGGVFFCC